MKGRKKRACHSPALKIASMRRYDDSKATLKKGKELLQRQEKTQTTQASTEQPKLENKNGKQNNYKVNSSDKQVKRLTRGKL